MKIDQSIYLLERVEMIDERRGGMIYLITLMQCQHHWDKRELLLPGVCVGIRLLD